MLLSYKRVKNLLAWKNSLPQLGTFADAPVSRGEYLAKQT